jgi:hypothetical protein
MSCTSSVLRRRPALKLALLLVGACTDGQLPTAPTDTPPDIAPPLPQVIACRADVGAGTVACSRPQEEPAPGLSLLILGGQGTFVQLTSTNVSYDGGSQVFQADVTVQNLIAQALGTTDGTTLDADGVRVFFHAGPTVTAGTGTVTVANADGTGTFTGSNQPYFQYDELLATGLTSAAKTWQWSLPPTVTTFTFQVYVWANVQHPDGWVSATPDAIVIPSGATQQVTASVLDKVGREQTAADKNYTPTDPSVVTVSETGLISAVNDGTAQVIVTSPPCTPDTVAVIVTSDGVTRQWVGGDAAGPTDWGIATNWTPAGTPALPDTVIVPTGASAMPVLGASTAVGRVEVEDQATLSLAGHTLTVWRDVLSPGQVVGPGLLTLAAGGGEWELAGSVPSVLVTGTYELVGPVTVLGSLTVRGGYLNDKGFHLLVRQPAP